MPANKNNNPLSLLCFLFIAFYLFVTRLAFKFKFTTKSTEYIMGSQLFLSKWKSYFHSKLFNQGEIYL